jgi:dihydroneopterin aldolase
MRKASQTCLLSVSDLRLWVHLGCTEEEKLQAQCVSLDFAFDFSTPPKTMKDDKLGGTVCYGQVSDAVKKFVKDKRFNTIEFLGAGIFDTVAALLRKQKQPVAEFSVTVHKLYPPVEGLHGGARFTVAGAPK